MRDPDALVIGAGPAGLACAATLASVGCRALVLEKAGTVGAVWRTHYDRLRLHTDRASSGLPGLAMPRGWPQYPSRAQVVDYLESYAAHFAIVPRFHTAVTRIGRDGVRWRVEAGESLTAPVVVVATGIADAPHKAAWPGSDSFRGTLIHSSAYRNPTCYAGQRVLVVGYGNSGGEIALDLAEAGIAVTLAVRGPVQILPRDLLGLPLIRWAILYRHLPAGLVDSLNAPIIRLAVGRTDHLGLRRPAKGPMRSVKEDRSVPIFDIGTLAKIRDGTIEVRGAIARLTADDVVFADGRAERYDAIILATGFRSDLRPLLPDVVGVLDTHGMPLVTGARTAAPGLYFCGQTTSATGQLREIGIEAKRIADLVHAERQSERALTA